MAARVPTLEVYSSITLNSFVDGFNPTAVEHALETGVRVVWLPTFSAANFDPSGIDRGFSFSNQSLTTLEDGTLRPEVRDVLETSIDYDSHVALDNGHLAPAESITVLDTMEEISMSVPYPVTYVDFGFMGLSVEDQLTMADRGVVVEKCSLLILHGDVSLEELASSTE